MVDEPQVDHLLDEWEELRESNPRFSLEQFINDRLGGADFELIESFQRQAVQLASIERKMEQIAGPLPTSDDTPKQEDNNLRLSSLSAGLEPIPGYTLGARLGGGGFGEVWKAESPGGFKVALKFVQIGGRAGEVEERSLEVIKNVHHPHLLSVFGTWRIGALLIIATELADCTLYDRLHEAQKEGHEGIPKDELLVYLAEAAKGIDFLNDPGKLERMRIQHRDIKPQNLLLSGSSVKVGDFGLARSIQCDVTGHTGSMTFAYAAPECFEGATSNRSDQYSLAITYCHLRGGRLPFDGTLVEIMEGHRKKQPNLSMIPAEERPAIAKALAKLPKDRWPSCQDFVRELSASTATKSSESTERPSANPKQAPQPRWVKNGAILFLVGLLLIMFWKLSGNRTHERLREGHEPRLFQLAGDQIEDSDMKRESSSTAEIKNSNQDLDKSTGDAREIPPPDSLEILLKDFPLSFVMYDVIKSDAARFPDEKPKYSLVARIDNEQYQVFTKKLDSFLAPAARSSEDGTLGLASESTFGFENGLLQYGKTSPTSLTNAIHKAIGFDPKQKTEPEGCVILVGKSFLKTPWGSQDEDSLRDFEGGDRMLTIKWYWVSESTVHPLMMAFRQLSEIQILLSAEGIPLPVIRPVRSFRGSERRLEHITSPGGPSGRIFHSGIGGGDLNVGAARLDWEKAFRSTFGTKPGLDSKPILNAERVLLVMPGFLSSGVFSEEVKIADLPPTEVDADNIEQLKIQVQRPE